VRYAFGRLRSLFRRRRYVRLQCISPANRNGPAEITVEGYLVGVWDGHYILERRSCSRRRTAR
jgi:hypothetical protein